MIRIALPLNLLLPVDQLKHSQHLHTIHREPFLSLQSIIRIANLIVLMRMKSWDNSKFTN